MVTKHVLEYFSELKKIMDATEEEKIEEVVDLILGKYANHKHIFIFGNGGSATTASHFACDINKGVSVGLEKRFRVICLNDNIATMLAYANDISHKEIFVEQLKNFLNPGDLVIGISSSGNSRNVINAIEYANKNQAATVAFTGAGGGMLSKNAVVSIIVPTKDTQKIEDTHLIIIHIIMQILVKKLIITG